MIVSEDVYNHIKTIFISIQRCETHFHLTKSHEVAIPFGKKLMSTAVNFCTRLKTQRKSVLPTLPYDKA